MGENTPWPPLTKRGNSPLAPSYEEGERGCSYIKKILTILTIFCLIL
jgi:hypothetical protein